MLHNFQSKKVRFYIKTTSIHIRAIYTMRARSFFSRRISSFVTLARTFHIYSSCVICCVHICYFEWHKISLLNRFVTILNLQFIVE